MMDRDMSNLKAFTGDDILELLDACADYLELSYQETNYPPFWETSMEAKMAREYLLIKLDLANPATNIH